MSGAALRIRLDDGAHTALAALIRRAGDLFPLMDEIGGSLVTSTQRRFETGLGPGGQAWMPARRGGRTLVDTGRLLASITHNADRRSVEIGSNVIYAATHQFGRDAIPARPFLGADAGDEREIEAIANDYLRRAI